MNIIMSLNLNMDGHHNISGISNQIQSQRLVKTQTDHIFEHTFGNNNSRPVIQYQEETRIKILNTFQESYLQEKDNRDKKSVSKSGSNHNNVSKYSEDRQSKIQDTQKIIPIQEIQKLRRKIRILSKSINQQQVRVQAEIYLLTVEKNVNKYLQNKIALYRTKEKENSQMSKSLRKPSCLSLYKISNQYIKCLNMHLLNYNKLKNVSKNNNTSNNEQQQSS